MRNLEARRDEVDKRVSLDGGAATDCPRTHEEGRHALRARTLNSD